MNIEVNEKEALQLLIRRKWSNRSYLIRLIPGIAIIFIAIILTMTEVTEWFLSLLPLFAGAALLYWLSGRYTKGIEKQSLSEIEQMKQNK